MNDESTAYSVDKRWLRRSFDRASTTYDASAVLQTEVRRADEDSTRVSLDELKRQLRTRRNTRTSS
jgi:hypothetical protein